MRDLIKNIIRDYLFEDKALYTIDELKQIASQYQSFKEFIQKEPKALDAIRRKGKDFTEELTGHMDKSHYKKWSDEDLRKEALKYSTKTDFQKGSGSAEFTARNRGKDFFDDITSHMVVKKKTKWSDDELKDEAKKYEFKIDFQKNSPKEYQVALKRGRDFFDKITQHLKPSITQWTDQMLRDEALKYKTKQDFRKSNPSASQTAQKRGKNFWDEVTSHMVDLHKKWDEKSLGVEAKKYENLSDFWKFSSSAAQTAMDKGREFYEDITSHMNKLTLWTDEMIKDEAKKYKTRSEFQRNGKGAYSAATNRGILDDVTMHMEPVGSRYQRLIYAYEFPDNHVYVGLTYNLDKRDRSHTQKETSAVFRHMIETGLKPIRKSLTGYMDKNEAVKKENDVLDSYILKGWIPLNIAKTGSLGGGILKWTDDKIREEVSKFNTLNDFYKNSRSAFNAAKNRGEDFFNEVTKNLVRKIEYSTDKQLADRAKLYKTKSEFMKNDLSSYQKALRRGDEFFKSITAHMVPMRKKWTEENLRKEALKYQSKKSFHGGSPSAYNAAKNRGFDFFVDITKHMADRRNPKNR